MVLPTPGPLVESPDYALAFRLIEPVPPVPRRLLLLLHGVGGQEGQLASLGAEVARDTLVVLPRAPRSVGEGMFGWFRVAFTAQGPRIVPEEAEESRQALVDFIGQLQAHHDVPPARTVVAGFSQGGILSASVALTAPRAVAGFAVLCGRILPEIAPRLGPREALARLHALVVHGRGDDKLPVAWAERADAWLADLGVPHVLRLHDAGHALTAAMRADFLDWFAAPKQPWMDTEGA
ncbi:MAG: phospholipase [Lysobacter sp.]|nr:phospholipase [Lysobacter sp.]